MKEDARERQAGQAMLEFAFTFILLMVIVMLIIDLSRAVHARAVMANAAREGARYAVVHARPTVNLTNVVNFTRQGTVGLDQEFVTVTASLETRPAPVPWNQDKTAVRVRVDVIYRFRPILTLGGFQGIMLYSRSRMVVDGQ